jgi:hypothetical protein
MTDRPDLDPALSEPAGPKTRAAEQFIHGLLETLHRDGPHDRERRISALLSTLSDTQAPARRRWRIARWPVASGLAAAVALAGLVLLSVPTGGSAASMVQASLAAVQTAGERRYEVRVMPPRGTQIEADPIATLDIGDADHVLIRARTPHGDRITVGRNPAGSWAIRPDGSIDRYPPRRAWPRWVDLGESTLMLESVDEMLASLEESYTLTRSAPEAVPTGQGASLARISAVRKANPSPTPRRVELWINPQSHVVQRMELHWDPPPLPPPHRDRTGPRPDRPLPDDFGPGDRPPPPGPGRERPPPRDDFGPGGRPPPGPDGDRPPPAGDRRHPPPEFLGAPPDFNGGRHPPPPRMIIFELVQDAPFPPAWFDPATHALK